MKALTLLAALLLFPALAQAETLAFGRGSWAELLRAHQGRPLVVHFWSLSCAPCLVELPQWREAQRRHPGMDLVLVSTDPLEDAPKMEHRLAKAGLGKVENWAFADDFAERLRFEIDKSWRGELPMTRMIHGSGASEAITGTVSAATLETWMAKEKP